MVTRSELMFSNCGVIEDCSWCHGWRRKLTNGCYRRRLMVSWVEKKTNKWMLDMIRSVLVLIIEYGVHEDEGFWPHHQRDSMEKILMQGNM